MRILKLALLAALLMALAIPALAELDAIDHYVVKADVRAYMTDEDMEYYRKAIDAVLAREDEVRLSDDYDANLRVLGALSNNPLYFLVEKEDFNSKHTKLRFQYAYSEAEQAEKVTFMDEEMLKLINGAIQPGMNELEQALAIYQAVVARIDYDYDWLEAMDMSDDKFLFPQIEIYQALSTGKGVCHTYTFLYEYALQQLGIECLRYTGNAIGDPDEGHMWPVVRIDGEYYQCDPTWDDQGEVASLQYFGMTDAERIASGIEGFEFSLDSAYGEVVCNSEKLAPLHAAMQYSLSDDHILLLSDSFGNSIGTFQTETCAFSAK